MDAVTDGHQLKIITVQHACANGWHEFTCPQIPGFYLLSEESDLESAYEQVPDALSEIIESDEGIRVTVTNEDSYSEYVAKLPEEMRPSFRHYSVKSAA
jgi:hypothetical protein